MIKQVVLIICLTGAFTAARGQNVAVKTNLLYGVGTLTPNLGVEIGLGQRTTLDLTGGYNPWNRKGSADNNKKLVHYLVQPEFRYWTRERFSGHFFGVHGLYSMYNIGRHDVPLLFDRKFRYEGYAVGGGISYGYLWNFARRWGAEFTVGVGVAYMNYDKFDCATCGSKIGNYDKTYFGPTKAGISLVYMIGGKKKAAPAPAYVPMVVPATPEPAVPVVVEQPKVEPIPVPAPVVQTTTAEKLAENHSFLAPASEYETARLKASSGELFGNKTGSSANRTDLEDFINGNREGSLTFYFRQGGKTVDRNYMNNESSAVELIAAVQAIENSADSRIVRVVIAGFASPEGSKTVNDRLAMERAMSLQKFITENSSITASKIDVHNGGVDWWKLRKMVDDSNMTRREQVLDIIDNTPVWDARRQVGRLGTLMNLGGGEPYRYMLRNFFPELRNATYIRVYFENTAK